MRKRVCGVAVLLLFLLSLCYGAGQEPNDPSEEIWIPQSILRDREERDSQMKAAQTLLSDMVSEDAYLELSETMKAHELFSDEWYNTHIIDLHHVGLTLTDPYLYVLRYDWFDNTKENPEGMRYFNMAFNDMDPSSTMEFETWFDFFVWCVNTDQGTSMETDFSQKLFRHVLWECSSEHYEKEGSYLIGFIPSEGCGGLYPLFDLLGEDMVLISDTEDEQLETVFRDVCERMHEIQEKVSGDLGQPVRFGLPFDYDYYMHHDICFFPDDPENMFDDPDRCQRYYEYQCEQANVALYFSWLEECGPAYPEFRLDFHSGYDDEKQDIFRQMCDYRRKYLEERQKKEEEELPEEPTQWIVKKGDSLWGIARQYYGDGGQWRQIYEWNREVIGEDENTIFPGQVLELPQLE